MQKDKDDATDEVELMELGEGGRSGGERRSCKRQGQVVTSMRPADHIKSWTNHDPPCAEEVGQSFRRTLGLDPLI